MTSDASPPGWPKAVRSPHLPGWEESATAWLLDLCPADYRAHDVLRRYPLVLVRFAAHHVISAREGAREAYAAARRELGDRVEPEVIEAALRALESEGARLSRTVREVSMVEEALLGTRWRPRL